MSPIRPENRDRYPDDWDQIRDEIMQRAGRRCECCGECGHHATRCDLYHDQQARKADGSDLYTVVLTVAHLDHTPENNDRDNLKAMCQPCHLRYDAGHHAATAAATRRRRLEDAGQLTLGGAA